MAVTKKVVRQDDTQQPVERFDRFTVNFDKAERDPETGYIRVTDAVFTRTGVFRYINDDGSERLEFRPPEEVFAPEAMRSMQAIPLYNEHPPVRVTQDNATALRPTGATGHDLRRQGNNIIGTLALWDGRSIDEARNGKRDLSMGYTVDVIEQVGVSPEGIAYTHVQKNMRYNHVAQVDYGRAGNASFRVDGVPVNERKTRMDFEQLLAAFEASTGLEIERSDGKGAKVKIGDTTFSLGNEDELKAAQNAFKEFLKDVKAKLKSQSKEKDKGDGAPAVDATELAKLRARADAAEAEAARLKAATPAPDKDKLDAMVNERIALVDVAKRFKVDIKDKDNDAIKLAIIVADGCEEVYAKAQGPAYIQARYDMVKDRKSTFDNLEGFDNFDNPRRDSGEANANEAREDMISDFENRWRDAIEDARDHKDSFASA